MAPPGRFKWLHSDWIGMAGGHSAVPTLRTTEMAAGCKALTTPAPATIP